VKRAVVLTFILFSLSFACEAKMVKATVMGIKDTPNGRVLQVQDVIGLRPTVYDCLITKLTELSGISDINELGTGRIIYITLDDITDTGNTVRVHGHEVKNATATAHKIVFRKRSGSGLSDSEVSELTERANEQVRQETNQGPTGSVDQSLLTGRDWVDVSPWNPMTNEGTRPFVRFSPDGTYRGGRDGKLEGDVGHYQLSGRYIVVDSNRFEIVRLDDTWMQFKLSDGRIQSYKTNVVSALQGMQQGKEESARQEARAIYQLSPGPNIGYIRAMMICLSGKSPQVLNFGPVFTRDAGKVAKAQVRTTREQISPIDHPQPEVANVEALFEKADDGVLYLTRISFPMAVATCSVPVR
jgi:hypothetical protein